MSSIIKVNTYQDANGNALFSSDGSGNVTTSASGMQNTPSFRYGYSGTQTFTTDTYTVMQFSNKVWDTDDAFNISTYKFTVPTGKGGKYMFVVSASTSLMPADTTAFVGIQINGSNHVVAKNQNSSTTTQILQCSVIASLSEGQEVNAVYRQNANQNEDVVQAIGTYFTGYKLIGA